MTDALGTARNYEEVQAVLRIRADTLGLSRETIDRLAGVPAGYAAKTLAEVPIKRLGPDTLGPMLGALGVMLSVVPDPEAEKRHTARGEKRVEKYALNAAMHTAAVHFKISLRKIRKNARSGGENSRKFVGKRKARKLARKSAWYRWEKPKLVKLARGEVSAEGFAFCRWTPAVARAMLRGRQMGLTLHSHTKFSPSDATRPRPLRLPAP